MANVNNHRDIDILRTNCFSKKGVTYRYVFTKVVSDKKDDKNKDESC